MDQKPVPQEANGKLPKPKKPRWKAPTVEEVVSHQASDAKNKVIAYLKHFGYVDNNTSDTAVDFSTALKTIQGASGLNKTGTYDPATAGLMNLPRCGNVERRAAKTHEAFVQAGSTWNHTNLTYRFNNFTPDLTPSQVRTCFQGAFGRWEAVTPLTFTEVTSGGDIIISFVTGDRGDGTNFDGPGNVLAFTLYPSGGSSRYDEAEDWSESELSQVALHELGHAIGLAHSKVSQAVMWPFYDGTHPELHEDDMAGIHSLYGWRNPRWEQLDTNANTTAIMAASNVLYQMHPGQVWKYIGPPLTGWQLIDNQPNVVQIAGTTDGLLYQRRSDGGIARYNGNPNDWSLVDLNPDTVDIEVGGTELYQRHKQGAIYRFTGGNPAWDLLDNNPLCEQITAGGSGQLYQRHSNGDLWRYIGPGINWELLQNGTGAGPIVAGGDKLYQLANHDIWMWSWASGGTKTQTLLDNNPATVGIAASGTHLYQIHNTGKIWRYTGTPLTGWEVMDEFSGTSNVIGNEAGDVFQRHTNGEIWRLVS